jgi:hypothetical protein
MLYGELYLVPKMIYRREAIAYKQVNRSEPENQAYA